MFRDLKEYQNLQKLYSEKVSKPENLVENERGSAFANNNNTKIKTRDEVGLKNNIKLNNKKVDTSFDSSKIIKNAIEKKNNLDNKNSNTSGLNLKDMQRYSNNREVTMKDFTPAKEVEIKKESEISKLTKQGKERTPAQMAAAKRIASGKTIADVKKANTDAMRAKAAERFAAFKAKRAAKKEAKMNEDITPYDIVLEYLLSSEQAATIEEANYVMTEMDGKTINDIVEMQGQINRADITGGTLAAKNAAAGKGKYTPGKGVTKDFKLDPTFKLPKV